jgi:group I intron endonuclease
MIYSIYEAKHKENGKRYIGYTELTSEQRWERHQKEVTYWDSKWHRALKKYGRNAFDVTCIYQTKELQEVLLREIYFIKLFDSIKRGYNTHEGGHGGNTGAYHKVGRKGSANPMFGRKLSVDNKEKMTAGLQKWRNNLTPEQQEFYANLTSKIHKGRKWKQSQLDNLKKAMINKPKILPYKLYCLTSPTKEIFNIVGKSNLSKFCKDNRICLWVVERILLKGLQPKLGSCVGWKAKT